MKNRQPPGLNQGPLTLVVSAPPPELWPPGDSQPSQFSISHTCMSTVCILAARNVRLCSNVGSIEGLCCHFVLNILVPLCVQGLHISEVGHAKVCTPQNVLQY